MDEVTIKSELIDHFSLPEGQSSQVSETEDGHKNDVGYSSTQTEETNMMQFGARSSNITPPKNKFEEELNEMSSIKAEQDLRQLKEDPSFVNNVIYIKEEPLRDAAGEQETDRTTIKTEQDLDFIKTEEVHEESLSQELQNENPNMIPSSPAKDINEEENRDNDTQPFPMTTGDDDKERLCQTKDKNHKRLKSYNCTHCDYKANQKSHLVSHLMSHTGEKPFSCQYCDYKTNRKCSLVRHSRTHTEEKPFNCSNCDYKTNDKSHLMRHLKIHRGEKSLSCL